MLFNPKLFWESPSFYYDSNVWGYSFSYDVNFSSVVMLIYLNILSLFVNLKKNLVSSRESIDLDPPFTDQGLHISTPVNQQASAYSWGWDLYVSAFGFGTPLPQLQEPCAWKFEMYTQNKKFTLTPHPHQYLLSLEFLILAILNSVRWNLKSCFDLHFPDD